MKLKDYLHYYLGVDYWTNNSQGNLNAYTLPHVIDMCEMDKGVQIHLRKLEDITDDECWEIHLLSPFWAEGTSQKYMMDRIYLIRERVIHQHLIPTVFHYLLKQGFDLFKLIENSQAIDSKTLK